jgi:two-component system, sensor histidine kinase YesM
MLKEKGSTGIHSVFFRLLMIFLLVLIPMYTTSILIYQQWMKNMEDDIAKTTVSQMNTYLSGLENSIDQMKLLQFDCLNDIDLNKLAIRWEIMDTYSRVISMSNLQQRLNTIRNSSAYIKDVRAHIVGLGRTISSPDGVNPLDEAHFLNVRVPRGASGDQILQYEGDYCLTTLREDSVSGRNPLYMIEIRLDKTALGNSLKALNIYDDSHTILRLNSDGVIADREASLAYYEEDAEPLTVDGRFQICAHNGVTYYRAVVSSENLNAKLIRYIPTRVIRIVATTPSFWFWVILVSALCVALIYFFSIYKYMHRPLYKLVDAFRELENGKLDVELTHNSGDEFGYLFDHFNEMVRKLSSLIDQVFKQKLLTQRAELKQLQTQINPHFLYNSLFIINTMARVGDEHLVEFSELLGEYYKFITRNGSDMVPLREDVKHGQTYAAIQQMRFSKRLKIDFPDCPDAFASQAVPRLILQPVLENAIEHGVGNLTKKGLIRVGYLCAGDRLQIRVEDNGKNLTDEQIARLATTVTDSAENDEITGMVNIHRRLRLVYGAESGLSIERSELGGLSVTLTICFQNGGAE